VKVKVYIQGACLLARSKKTGQIRVLMINTSDPSTFLTGEPTLYHHPLLITKRASVDPKASARPLSTLVGLVDPLALMTTKRSKPVKLPRRADPPTLANYTGWYLSGQALTLGTAGPVSLVREKNFEDESQYPKNGKWSDWRRIADIRAIFPQARLKKSFLSVGNNTLATVDLSGGSLGSYLPANDNCTAHILEFSPNYKRAVTDRALYEFEQPGAALTLQVGGQVVRLKGKKNGTLSVWFVNEAPPAEMHTQQLLTKSRAPLGASPIGSAPTDGAPLISAPHFVGFYRAFDNIPRPEAPKVGDPTPLRINLQDSPQCPEGYTEY